MYKLKPQNWLISSLLLVALLFPFKGNVYAQATKTNKGDVVCPATGTSIEVLPQRLGRFSYFLNNVTGQQVFIGNQSSGTAALTGTSGGVNSAWRLQPGQAFADSVPNVVALRVTCMSVSGVSATISFGESYR